MIINGAVSCLCIRPEYVVFFMACLGGSFDAFYDFGDSIWPSLVI
jgi:hypothetical protein